MVRSINYFWVLPTMSIQSKGSDSLQSAGSSPGFSVRWSSTSTILTFMAWRSNILQKSFVRDCASLLKNDLRFTRRWQSLQLAVACCAFSALFMCYQKCLNFAVRKVLPSGFWWMLSVFCCWGSVLILLRFIRLAHLWCCCQTFVSETTVGGLIRVIHQNCLMLSDCLSVSYLLLRQHRGIGMDAVSRLLLRQHLLILWCGTDGELAVAQTVCVCVFFAIAGGCC